eukprot:TRINITY_DN39665_c0_g1_i1.p2 TRINITY_DN39665_c0_g1~~TRINITY_DN39665_c0_g1_i1.p2  ORF type:complete len:118 (-),score=8.30 TRINITY_DN39665_c0_g1_i1:422-775(-)
MWGEEGLSRAPLLYGRRLTALLASRKKTLRPTLDPSSSTDSSSFRGSGLSIATTSGPSFAAVLALSLESVAMSLDQQLDLSYLRCCFFHGLSRLQLEGNGSLALYGGSLSCIMLQTD